MDSVKEKWLYRDRLINGITADGAFRIAVVKANTLVQTAINRHELNPLEGIILARLLIAASLATSVLKGEERISFKIDSKGPIKAVFAEANAMGEVRGYVQKLNTLPDLTHLEKAIKESIGEGSLHYTKILMGDKQPYVSSVPLVESDVSKDIAFFYVQSEQIPTAIRTCVTLNDDFTIKHAAGYLVQAMPNATETAIAQMEEHLKIIKPLDIYLAEGHYIDKIMFDVLSMYEVKELTRRPLDFFCSCSRERFKSALISLGKKQLKSLSTDAQQELVCHFCNEKYIFQKAEIIQLLFDLEHRN